jgi:hypothetical protein
MIEITAAQAKTLSELTQQEGTVSLHQVAHEDAPVEDSDLYATPHGKRAGYRIARDGRLSQIGETLPSPG